MTILVHINCKGPLVAYTSRRGNPCVAVTDITISAMPCPAASSPFASLAQYALLSPPTCPAPVLLYPA